MTNQTVSTGMGGGEEQTVLGEWAGDGPTERMAGFVLLKFVRSRSIDIE